MNALEKMELTPKVKNSPWNLMFFLETEETVSWWNNNGDTHVKSSSEDCFKLLDDMLISDFAFSSCIA